MRQRHYLIFALAAVLMLWTAFEWTRHHYATPVSHEYEDLEEGSARFMSLGTPKEVKKQTQEETQVILNDPNMSRNWGLIGTEKDIKVSKAWEITQGSRDITIAVIDTGLDIHHPDLAKNLWRNPGETGLDKNGKDKATNGVDDDGNGFVDDVHGWNFVTNSKDLKDNHGHGTHVAGIAGAEGGNGIGISGVAPKVSIMVLKYYDPKSTGNDNLKNTIRAINYAVSKGAHIINYSGGGLDYSKEEYDAVKSAREKGILFVAAAGNEKSNSDFQPYYPANYDLDNIISVTAINKLGKVLNSSNFGERSVHIAAPGENIYSTLPDNKYGEMTGTSQATSFVSGVAALIMANNGEFNYQQVRRQILSTADQSAELFGKASTAGILNSWAALAIQPMIPASGVVIQPLAQTGTTDDNVSLSKQLGGLMEVLRLPAQGQN